MTWLKHFGQVVWKVFQKADAIATKEAPVISEINPAFGLVFSSAIGLIHQAEALGASAAEKGNTNEQKAALVVAALKPVAQQALAGHVGPITDTNVKAATDAAVAFLNAWAAPADATSPVQPMASPSPAGSPA